MHFQNLSNISNINNISATCSTSSNTAHHHTPPRVTSHYSKKYVRVAMRRAGAYSTLYLPPIEVTKHSNPLLTHSSTVVVTVVGAHNPNSLVDFNPHCNDSLPKLYFVFPPPINHPTTHSLISAFTTPSTTTTTQQQQQQQKNGPK